MDMAIAVWGDDNQTSAIDGFKDNEIIAYRVYRLAEQKEWSTVETGYSEGTGNYSTDGFMVLNKFNVSDAKTITLDFDKGWNLFSMNVNPTDPNVATVMAPVVNDLKILKNGDGETYIPSYSINTIGDMNFKEGYQAYFTSAVTLPVTGNAVSPNTPIELIGSWNMIGYLPDMPINIEIALATIVDKIKIAKNGQGESYIPQYSINQIGDMQPGEGYKVCLTTPATLIYPASSALGLMVSDNPRRTIVPRHFKFTVNTGENATIVLPAETAPKYSDNTLLEVGDEIGVFNSKGLCCGAVEWQAQNTALTVWSDNNTTEEVDGFKAGETLQFRIWRKSTDEEFSARVYYQKEHPAVYQTDGFSVLTELVAFSTADVAQIDETPIPTDFRLLQNYPNPFNPATLIRYELPEALNVTIEIYNHLGQRIRTLVNREQLAGIHQCAWDGRNESGKTVPSGVYFYRLQSKAFSATKKMLFMH